jgi:hypothetical protein
MTTATYTLERKPVGYEQVTVGTTAVGLTVPPGATKAVIRVDAQPVRFRDDGTNPTSSTGFLFKDNDIFEAYGESILQGKFIRDGGTNATLNVLYYSY